MMKEKRVKEAGDVRRLFFAENVTSLIEGVLRLNRLDSAETLGVDYGWLRKACSIGLSRADSRNIEPLTKIAEKFHLSVPDLWTPQLLQQIWAGGYLPDVRDYLVTKFQFDQFVAKSRSFHEYIEDMELLGTLKPQATQASAPNAPNQLDAEVSANQLVCDQLKSLLATGRYDYLLSLINDLTFAETRLAQSKEQVSVAVGS